MQPPISIASGVTTAPFLVNPDGWVIIEAGNTSVTVQYTVATATDVASGAAVYNTVGTFTGFTAIRADEELAEVWVKLTTFGGSATYHVEGQLSRDDRLTLRGYKRTSMNGLNPTYALDSSGNVTGLMGPSGGIIPIIVNSTFANLATAFPAGSNSGRICRITDMNNALFESNGTRWKPINSLALIGSLDTDTSMSGTAETIMYQRSLPASILQNGDRLRVYFTASKSGVSETATYALRLGTSGTIADPVIQTFAALATTQISTGVLQEFKRLSATTIRKLGAGNSATSFAAGGVVTALATPVAVSSMDSNPMFLSLTIVSNAAAETITVNDFIVELLSSVS